MNSGNKQQSNYKNLINDTLIFAIGNLGSKLILFFMVPLYTHFLTREEYGISDLIFTVAQLAVPFVSLVIFDAVIRFGVSKYENKEDVLLNSLAVILLGSLVTILLTPLVSFYQPLSEWRWYVCIYIILNMTGHVTMNYLKVNNQNKSYATISIVQTMFLALSNFLFLTKLHWGVKGYLLSTIISSSSLVLLSVICGRVHQALRAGSLNRRLLKKMILFSCPLIFNNVSWWVIQSSDKIMVEAFVGVAALGLYTAASKIPSLINVTISIFSQSWGISSVREYETSNDLDFYSSVFAWYSTFSFGIALLINIIVKPFMHVYVSNEFFDAWRFVPLLLVSASFSAVSSYFGSLYGAIKKTTNNLLSTLFAAIINLVVNYFGIIKFGAFGAVLGTLSAYVFIAFYRMVDVHRFIRFNTHIYRFLINAGITVLHAILVSREYEVLYVSAAALVLYIIVNQKIISLTLTKLLKRN